MSIFIFKMTTVPQTRGLHQRQIFEEFGWLQELLKQKKLKLVSVWQTVTGLPEWTDTMHAISFTHSSSYMHVRRQWLYSPGSPCWNKRHKITREQILNCIFILPLFLPADNHCILFTSAFPCLLLRAEAEGAWIPCCFFFFFFCNLEKRTNSQLAVMQNRQK